MCCRLLVATEDKPTAASSTTVARGEIEPPTFRFSGGVPAYTNVFQPVEQAKEHQLAALEQLTHGFGPHFGPMDSASRLAV